MTRGGSSVFSIRGLIRTRFWLVTVVILFACDDGGSDPGEDRFLSLRSKGVQRVLTVYVPADRVSEDGSPLIVAFHGTPGTGPGMRSSTGLDEVADELGWIVAYPNGTGGSWAAGCLCSDADLAGVDDVQFVKDLIDKVDDEYGVDRSQVFTVGFSAGGILNYRLACDLSTTIAAAASVGSSMTWAQADSCTPEDPISVLTIVGTSDAAFPWTGSGLGPGQTMPIDSTFSFWGRANSCEGSVTTDYLPNTDNGFRVRRESDSRCSQSVEVSLLVIVGGQHTWPETANVTLRSFFERHAN